MKPNLNEAAENQRLENPAEDGQAPLTKRSRSKKSSSAFKTISEVAKELDVQQHVLRFWETKFLQIKPLKRGGGRRYYRPEDVALLKTIHTLLYAEGYTIKGVQKLLREQGKNSLIEQVTAPETQSSEQRVVANPSSDQGPANVKSNLSDKQKTVLRSMLNDLKDLRDIIASD